MPQTRLLRLQLIDLRRAEAQSDSVTRRYANLLRKSAKRAAIAGGSPRPLIKEQQRVVADVVKLMMATVDKNQRVHVRRTGVQPAPVDDELLRKMFTRQARAVINDSMAHISKMLTVVLREDRSKTTAGKMRSVSRVMKTLGVTPSSDYHVKNLVRTLVQSAYGASIFLTHGEDSALWGFMYMTAEDERVRPEHMKLHGMRRKRDDREWVRLWPPNGWNCRCQVLPLYGKHRATRIPHVVIEPPFDFNEVVAENLDSVRI